MGVDVLEVITGIIVETCRIFVESSFFMLMGLFVAGLIRVFLQPSFVARYFGSGKIKSVFYASLIGVPIPL